MFKHGTRWATGLGLALVALMAGVGCVETDPGRLGFLLDPLLPPLDELFTFTEIAGASEREVIIARTKLPQELLDAAFPSGSLFSNGFIPGTIIPDFQIDRNALPPPPITQVVAVDFDTLDARMLVEIDDSPVLAPEMRSDGRWLAWRDNVNQTIRVMDLDAGTPAQPLVSALEHFRNGILALDAGRLVASGRNGDVRALSVFDLASGAETVLEGYLDGAAVLNGDRLAAVRVERVEPDPPDGTSSTIRHLEVLDLVTGETLADIADESVQSARLQHLTDTQLIWTVREGSYNTPRVTVFAYDLGTGRTETIVEIAPPSDAIHTMIVDVGDAGILLSSRRAPAGSDANLLALLGTRITQSFDLTAFDGTTRTLFEYSFGVFEAPLASTDPALLGVRAVFRDPRGGGFVVVDLDSGDRRGFDPFAGLD